MVAVRGPGGKLAPNGAAGRGPQGAADQGAHADADAVGVEVVLLNNVPEQQPTRAAAVHERGPPRVLADGEQQLQIAADMDHFRELDAHLDAVAQAVQADRDEGHLRHRRRIAAAGVHLVLRKRARRRQAAFRHARIVADAVFDQAADQRVGADADAVVVEIAGLHRVAEPQLALAAAGGVVGVPRAFADGKHQLQVAGRFGHVDRFRELHVD